jgi:hypothetical protein
MAEHACDLLSPSFASPADENLARGEDPLHFLSSAISLRQAARPRACGGECGWTTKSPRAFRICTRPQRETSDNRENS